MSGPSPFSIPLVGVELRPETQRKVIPDVRVHQQRGRHLCWAAVGASVAKHLGYQNLATEEAVAKAVLGGAVTDIDQPQELAPALKAAKFGGKPSGFLKPRRVETRIWQQARPIAISLELHGYGTHAVLITGTTLGGTYAYVEDPIDQTRAWLPTAKLGASYRSGARWSSSFVFKYGIR